MKKKIYGREEKNNRNKTTDKKPDSVGLEI